MNNLNIDSFINKQTGDPISADEWNALFGNIQSKINELVSASNNSGGGNTGGNQGGTTVVGGNVTKLYVNGTLHTESLVILKPNEKYTISGELYGRLVVDAQAVDSSQITKNTQIILDGVKIVSPTQSCIEYAIPVDGKGYKGMVITLGADSVNTLIAEEIAERGDDQPGVIYSHNNLRVQGTGYLVIKSYGGHGMRGSEIRLFNPHVYIDAVHDGVHAKTIVINDGVYYFEKCNDCFGTSNKDDALILIDGGKYFVYNLVEKDSAVFDCKGQGYYIEEPQIFGSICENFVNGTTAYKAIYNNIDDVDTLITRQQAKVMVSSNKDAFLVGNYNDVQYSGNGYVIDNTYTGKECIVIQGNITAPIIIESTYKADGINMGGAKIYLNNAKLTVNTNVPAIYYKGDSKKIKVNTMTGTYNKILQTYAGPDASTSDVDGIKSESNLELETGGDSYLYITSANGDGIDASDVKLTDFSSTIVIKNCGQRGIKGTTICIGPDADMSGGNIVSTVPESSPNYTSMDGCLIVKDNCKVNKPSDISGTGDASKLVGFADIFARKGKFDATKGVLKAFKDDINGVVITGTIGCNKWIDLQNSPNFFYEKLVSPKKLVNSPRAAREQYLVHRLGQTALIDPEKFKNA